MAEGLSKDEIISSFCGITGVSSSEAQEYLDTADWNADAALAEFFQSQEDEEDAGSSGAAPAAATPGESAAAAYSAHVNAAADASYTGPRTLDGRPAPQSSSPSTFGRGGSSRQPAAAQQKKKGLMTMDSLRGGGSGPGGPSGGGGHGHAHDDDDDDDDGGRGDLFAGGEKSGLAVHDPKMSGHTTNAQKLVRNIVAKAKTNRSSEPAGPSEPSRFRGSGMTLGGEGAESRVIPDPSARSTPARGAGGAAAAGGPEGATQERVLHLWQDGFSIDDGPLHRYDDPRNAADLQMIQNGRAPLHLMNVSYDQPVDVKLNEHDENWHQLPRIYRPFSGEGRRLGAPTPGSPSTASVPVTVPSTSVAGTSSAASAASAAVPTVDESQPTLTIRVQLPDGTRLPARFNTTQTIGDIYAFVASALPAAQQTRAWVIATTFPNKDHTDKDLVLGETAEFKRGGAAVVKWV